MLRLTPACADIPRTRVARTGPFDTPGKVVERWSKGVGKVVERWGKVVERWV